MSQTDTVSNKSHKIFQFYRFYEFFLNFRQTSSIETLKRINKEKICCPIRLEKVKMQFLK